MGKNKVMNWETKIMDENHEKKMSNDDLPENLIVIKC